MTASVRADPSAALPPISAAEHPTSRDAIVRRYGLPDVAVSDLLAYRGSFSGLSATICFFVPDDRLSELTVTFPASDLSPKALRRHADRVLKHLRTLYGVPASISRVEDTYKTHLWRSATGELIHTVVYASETRLHVIRAIPRNAL
jgi:hypothetical protein